MKKVKGLAKHAYRIGMLFFVIIPILAAFHVADIIIKKCKPSR